MTPPLKEVRLRSILRWMKEHSPPATQERAVELDEQMVEAFEAREQARMEAMMRDRTWGTDAGLRSFQTERLTMWSELLEEFLPVTIPEPIDTPEA